MASRSFTTFELNGGQLFGIDILFVREINKQLDLTVVPQASEYIRGLVNLRGQIVTILDLNQRLGLEQTQLSEASHNIILKTDSELQGSEHQETLSSDKVGLLVEDIRDVVTIEEEAIEAPPANIGKIDGQYLSGVIKLDNALIGILSLQKVLSCSAEN